MPNDTNAGIDETPYPMTGYQLEKAIDHILYGQHTTPFSKGDALMGLVYSFANKYKELLSHNEQRARLQGQIEVMEAAWLNSCQLPSADAISRSLAGKKRELEQQLKDLEGKS